MPPSSIARIEINFHQLNWTLRRSTGLANIQLFLPILPVTILFDSSIQIISRILVHSILVDLVERVVSSLEADLREVYRSKLGGVIEARFG